MLLGDKQTQDRERNWGVVLKRLENRSDREKVAEKFEKAFSVSREDAFDLMENTPIILLDHLPKDIALKAQDFFKETGAEVELSNDQVYKRRCYRTVWPTPPDLAFLNRIENESPRPLESKPLDENEALRELRSLDFSTPSSMSASKPTEDERGHYYHELVNLREECERWRLAASEGERRFQEKTAEYETLKQSEKQKQFKIDEIEIQHSNAEEKNQILREEFKDARGYYEERILAQEKKIEELDTTNRNLVEEKAKWAKEREGLIIEIQSIRKDAEGLYEVRNESLLKAEEELQKASEKQTAYKREIENLTADIDRFRLAQLRISESEKDHVVSLDLEKKKRLAEEMRSQKAQADLESLKLVAAEREKKWQIQSEVLEKRNRELEQGSRQAEKLYAQIEQKETLQKKGRVAENLASKDMRLKQLVKRQEQIEREARDREIEMQKLLEEQEAVERSMIEDRQAQRHLMERLRDLGLSDENASS